MARTTARVLSRQVWGVSFLLRRRPELASASLTARVLEGVVSNA